MRALALLMIVALAFLTVRWLAPTPDPVQAGEVPPELPEPTAGASFLPPPARAPEPSGNPTRPDPVVRPEASAPQDEPRFLTPAGLIEGELAAAAALAHGTPAEVQAAAKALPPERALLLEAFAWAVAGERQMAHSLAAKLDQEKVSAGERARLEAVLTGQAIRPAASSLGPVEAAMEIALLAREATAALAERRHAEAAQAFSYLLQADLAAPFAADPLALARWTEGLDAAQREHRWNPAGNWPSAQVVVEAGDSLISIRKRYLASRPEARLCTGMIERSNRLRGVLQPGQTLRIPTDAARIVVDLEARWALYFLGDEVAAAWPVGIGRPGEETPPGDYTAIEKTEKPSWMKVGQDPVPFGDPRNPLGTRWIGWSRAGSKTAYGFHGTSEPESIGRAASDGCVRLRNEDVEELFQILPEGAPIQVRGS